MDSFVELFYSITQVGVVVLEDGSLQILASEAGDTGLYKCVAENRAGSVQHEIRVKILGN